MTVSILGFQIPLSLIKNVTLTHKTNQNAILSCKIRTSDGKNIKNRDGTGIE
jgi:hypothetical protein